MMRSLIRYRTELAAIIAYAGALWLWRVLPFPDSALMSSIRLHRPVAYSILRGMYAAELFLLPLLYVWLPIVGVLYRVMRIEQPVCTVAGALPPFPGGRK